MAFVALATAVLASCATAVPASAAISSAAIKHRFFIVFPPNSASSALGGGDRLKAELRTRNPFGVPPLGGPRPCPIPVLRQRKHVDRTARSLRYILFTVFRLIGHRIRGAV